MLLFCFNLLQPITTWYARELQSALGYTEWRNFFKVIEKAKTACETTTHAAFNHFVDVNKMIPLAKGAVREVVEALFCYNHTGGAASMVHRKAL